MEFKDYYGILGVKKSASDKEIRTAYRKLARELHPDVNPKNQAAEKRFREVNEAYDVLSDPEKRKKFDQLGANWQQYEQWQRAGGARTGQPFDLNDLFAGARTGRPGRTSGGRSGGRSGGEYRTVSQEEIEELLRGGAAGTGTSDTGGGGAFSDFFEMFFGGLGRRGGGGTTTRGRTSAARAGHDLDQPVEISLEESFNGTTRVIQLTDEQTGRTRRIEVKIPAGMTDGSRVRIAGQGGPGVLGGPAGDLYLLIRLATGSAFAREGEHLRVRVDVPFTTAVLGGEIEVPSPKGGRLALKIPAGTQDGRTFRLRGQGMPRVDRPNEQGDLLAEIHARLPETLTDRQRELFQELASTL